MVSHAHASQAGWEKLATVRLHSHIFLIGETCTQQTFINKVNFMYSYRCTIEYVTHLLSDTERFAFSLSVISSYHRNMPLVTDVIYLHAPIYDSLSKLIAWS
jgi:hypothetical protein